MKQKSSIKGITLGFIISVFTAITAFFAARAAIIENVLYPCVDIRIRTTVGKSVEHLYLFEEMRALHSPDSSLWKASGNIIDRKYQ